LTTEATFDEDIDVDKLAAKPFSEQNPVICNRISDGSARLQYAAQACIYYKL